MNYMLPPAIQGQMMRDPRLALALQQQQTGTSSAPAQTWGEGLARALQAPIGAMMQRNVMQDYQGQADSYQKAMADALSAYGRGDIEGAAAAAGQNPYLQELGANLTIKGADMKSRERLAEQEAKQRLLLEQGRIERETQRHEQRETAAERRHRERMEAAEQRASLSGSSLPSSVQEWEYYNAMSPEDRERYLRMKRSDPRDALEARIELGGDAKAAEKGGEVRGKAEAEAQLSLPQYEADAQQTIDLIEQAINHPGMSAVVGVPGITKYLPGTDAKGFQALLGQITGKQFLQAFQSLQGGGQITEVEGRKATEAISRMANTDQGEKEWLQAAKEFQNIVRNGLERARRKAGMSGVGNADQPPPGVDPQTWQFMTPEERALFQ